MNLLTLDISFVFLFETMGESLNEFESEVMVSDKDNRLLVVFLDILWLIL